jgi:hypothetical protein
MDFGHQARSTMASFLAEKSPFRQELLKGNRQGGYLCVATSMGIPLLVCRIGEPDETKADKYLALCQEKARRLGANPDHDLSYQTRDPDNGQWGGAVRGHGYIVSFSGLPERLDEVLSAMVLFLRNRLPQGKAREILKGNPYTESFGLQQLAVLFDGAPTNVFGGSAG